MADLEARPLALGHRRAASLELLLASTSPPLHPPVSGCQPSRESLDSLRIHHWSLKIFRSSKIMPLKMECWSNDYDWSRAWHSLPRWARISYLRYSPIRYWSNGCAFVMFFYMEKVKLNMYNPSLLARSKSFFVFLFLLWVIQCS